MSDQPISMSRSGPPETVMPALEAHIAHELTQALASEPDKLRQRGDMIKNMGLDG